jgi:tRNA 2-selenouridine synthase
VERALIGTIYAKETPAEAFETGCERVLQRIAPMVEDLAKRLGRPMPTSDLEAWVTRLTEGGIEHVKRGMSVEPHTTLPAGSVVLHCWRGGLRSSSLVVLLRAVGWEDVFVLEGGYKSYRRQVLAELEAWQAPPAFVLRGPTGVGKTLVLREIERLRPGWMLDLEGHAGHRSSILGMVGLEPCNQKTFDSRMATRMRAGFPGPVVIEGESRKVGDSIVPDRVWTALCGGVQLRMEASMDYRIGVLIADYLEIEANRAPLREQLPFIERRLGETKWAGVLVDMLDRGAEEELVKVLLELYYDPLYQHSEKGREHVATFETKDVSGVAQKIVNWIEEHLSQVHAR